MVGDAGRGRQVRRAVRALSATALLISVASVVATPFAASAAPPHPRTASGHTPAFRTFALGGGETARNVCSLAVTAGHVACDALHRTDTAALSDRAARGRAHPAGTLGDGGAYSPAYLQSAYNIASATAAHNGGAGQIVAVVDAYSDPNIASDLAYYRNYFSLPTCPTGTVSSSTTSCVFEQINENGATSPLPAANSSWGVEESIDVDMVSAICPKCQILLVEASSTAIADVGTGVNAAVTLGANVVSNSYGGAEYAGENYDAQDYYQHAGVPIVASSGDNGYGVEFPAAAPDVVAVGGTTLTQATNTGTRNATETVWSDAGAGCSIYDAKPSWQTDTGCGDRTVADVSADANPSTGVWMYDSFGESGLAIYGGTSVAAPIIASIYALADNPASTGYAPSWLYANSASLTHITSGSDSSCGTYLCNAADSQNGYNGPTGFGSPGGSPNSLAAFTATAGTTATVPSAPSLTSATAGNGTVALSWSAPTSNGGSPVTGYDVYKGTGSGLESGTPVNATPLTTTSDTVTTLSNGTPYFFIVQAINAEGNSVASNELSATPFAPAPPSAPTLVSATPGNASATLTWTAPSSNGTSPLLGYNIYEGSSAGGESSTPVNGTTPVTGTSDQLTGLANNVTVYVKITAVNAVGNSTASNELSVTPVVPATPSSPSLLTATAGNAQATLTWSAPSSNGTSPLLGYDLFEGTSAGGESSTPVNGTTPLTGTSTLVTGLTNNVTVYFTISAVNAVGQSTLSNELSVTPFAPAPPSAPTLLTATPGNSLANLAWSAPSSNGTSPLLGYNLYEGTSPGGESSTPVNGTTPLTGTSTQAVGLVNGVTVYFKITAVNAVGQSISSNELSVTPVKPAAPSSPTLGSAVASDGEVALSWAAPSSNGTSPLEGYDIYVGTSAGHESTTPVNGSLITGTSDTVTGLTDGTTYYFTVEAVNAVGNSTASNELSAAPFQLTPPTAPTLTAATTGDGSASLTWSAPGSNGTSALEGYNVYVGTSAGSESATPANGALLTTTSDSVTGLTNNTTYFFTVKAVSSVGSSPASNEMSTTPFHPTPPSSPSLTSVVAGDGAVPLTWSAPGSNGTSALEGYNVFVGTSAGGESATPVNGSLITSTAYTVTGLTNNTTYFFTVTAVNAVGSSAASNEKSTTPFHPTAPSSPALTVVTAGDGTATLTWSAPDSDGTSALEGYNVFVGTTAGGESATPVNGSLITTTSDTVTGLTNNTTYFFIVKAVNAVGSSAASNEKSTTPFHPTAPSSPALTVVTAGDGTATLTWSAPDSDGTSALEGYNVYVGTRAGGESPTPVNGSLITTTSDTVTGLTNNTAYFFTVKAVSAVGSSTASNEMSTTPFHPTTPSSPSLTEATAGDGAATLTWSTPSSNGTSALEGYNVFVGTSAGGESVSPVNGSLITTTSETVTGLTNNTTYFFTVKAVSAVGSSTASNEMSTTPFHPSAPSSPTLIAATAGDGQVSLSWSAPTSTGTSALQGYNVFVGESAGAESVTPANGSLLTETTDTVTGLTDNTTYFFTVEAVNAVGSSASSNEMSTTPVHPTAPNSPTLTTATSENGAVALSWSAPDSSGTSALKGYDIYVGTVADGESTIAVNATLIAGTSDTVTDLTNGTTYFFEVEAVNDVGNSSPSNELSSTPILPSTPSSPTLTSAIAHNGTVSLTWSAPSSDGTSALEGYDVYVGTVAGGESTIAVNATVIAGTTDTVSGLTNGSTYFFTVAAVNASGNSGPSNELSATPVQPATPGKPTLATAVRGNGTVSLTWTAPPTDGTSALEGYDVYAGTVTGGESTIAINAGLITGTSDVISSLTNGTTYYFTVAAVNAVGVSSHSNELSATPMKPAAPTAPSLTGATRGNASVALTWSAPASLGTSPIEGYDIYVGTTSLAESATPTNKTLVTSLTDVVTGLTNAKTYFFRIRAVSAAGSSSLSNERSATPITPVKPTPPRTLVAKSGNAKLTLSWTAPSALGTSPLIGYDVFVWSKAVAPSAAPENKVPLTATTTTLTGLVNGTTYDVRVTAVTAAGASAPSATVAATPATTPGLVSALTADASSTKVTLHWSAPAATGGAKVTAYEIYRSTTAGSEVALAKVACTATTCTFTNSSLSPSTTYFYEVAAVNTVGTGRRSPAVSTKG